MSGYTENFHFNSATTYFAIESNMLMAHTRFDHDAVSPGPIINSVVKCEVFNRLSNQVVAVRDKLLRINVLDRNDNPPEIQAAEEISIKLDDPHFRKVNFWNFLFYSKRLIRYTIGRRRYDLKIAWVDESKKKNLKNESENMKGGAFFVLFLFMPDNWTGPVESLCPNTTPYPYHYLHWIVVHCDIIKNMSPEIGFFFRVISNTPSWRILCFNF